MSHPNRLPSDPRLSVPFPLAPLPVAALLLAGSLCALPAHAQTAAATSSTAGPTLGTVEGRDAAIGSDAVALGNAAVGERLNVRVPSGKVISGVVQEDLSVLIAAP